MGIFHTISVWFFVTALVSGGCFGSVNFSTHEINLKLNETKIIYVQVVNESNLNEEVLLVTEHEDVVKISPSLFQINRNIENISVELLGIGNGHSEVYAKSFNSTINLKEAFVRINVYRTSGLDTAASVTGWMYFLAWGSCYYPQIYINWKRKSVVGLNFDFLFLNILGFIVYSVFNLGLYFIPEVKNEYSERYPRSGNPVGVNDLVFSLHSTFATFLTIFQCFIYDRGDQKVSLTARGISASFGIVLIVGGVLVWCHVIQWLDFLYYCSYIKLTTTLIKYVPQLYMNYQRQSTDGRSVENIALDFAGGLLSMLQMAMNAFNYGDWVSIFGNFAKFGLGLFSMFFNGVFFVQHFWLYRGKNHTEKSKISA